MLLRNTNGLFTPAACSVTEHMWQMTYVAEHTLKEPLLNLFIYFSFWGFVVEVVLVV